MPLPFGAGETITLHRRVPSGNFDTYGNVVYTAITETIAGVAIWPASTSEATQNVDRTNTVYIVAVVASYAVDAIDSVTWRGLDYEVQGEVECFRSPFSGSALQTFRMARVEG